MKYVAVGDNVVDRYIEQRVMFPGGNAVNFSAFVAELGHMSSYVGAVADDREGQLVLESLQEIGVDVSACRRKKGYKTERCDVKIVDGERVFAGTSTGDKEWAVLPIDAETLRFVSGFDFMHSCCYSGFEEEFYRFGRIEAFKSYDFSNEEEYRTEEYLKKICPYIDLALFSHNAADEESMSETKEICQRLGARCTLFTMGADGQVFFDGDARYEGRAKMLDSGVVDTMGAGDSFFAAFLTSLAETGLRRHSALSDENIDRAFKFAADFAARNCMRDGAFGFGVTY